MMTTSPPASSASDNDEDVEFVTSQPHQVVVGTPTTQIATAAPSAASSPTPSSKRHRLLSSSVDGVARPDPLQVYFTAIGQTANELLRVNYEKYTLARRNYYTTRLMYRCNVLLVWTQIMRGAAGTINGVTETERSILLATVANTSVTMSVESVRAISAVVMEIYTRLCDGVTPPENITVLFRGET